MKIGTYYYPEQWPREQWERDFDHIASMGLQIVHKEGYAATSSDLSALVTKLRRAQPDADPA